MPLYDVHINAICRVKVWNVEAESMEKAIAVAATEADMGALYRADQPVASRPKENNFVEDCGYSESEESFLVDVVGDGDFAESQYFEGDGTSKPHSPQLLAAAPDLLDVLIYVLPYVEMAEHDEAYKPGAVAKVVRLMKETIAKAKAH